jgi:phosphoribosylanthranilate isomerase
MVKMSLKIKVCGMKYAANIKDLADLNPDFMGFIFYPPSKRFVGVDFQKQDIEHLSAEINRTSVFVNAHHHEIVEFANLYGIKTLQLHGAETPIFCRELMDKGFKVIKAFGIDENFNFGILNEYLNHVDFFLFDTKTKEHGGSGLSFDWEILQRYTLNKPFFISGGLSSENVLEVLKIKNPNFFGVDLNSKFEIEPGLKNIEQLKQAFKLIRA